MRNLSLPVLKALLLLLSLGISQTLPAQSTEGGHRGHGGSGGNTGNDVSCIRAKISNFRPGHLAEVAPGAAFSFTVSGSNGPGNIFVSVRQQPVAVQVEDKDSFYLVKGHLPAAYRNETVRVTVNARAKVGKCDADTGFLLKIGE